MTPELLDLPWRIQVSLAGGYLAYILAYSGNRSHHKTVDTVFLSFLFGLFALSIYSAIDPQQNKVAAGLSTLAASAMIGLVWRKFIRPCGETLLRETNFSWTNDDPSALVTLSNNSTHRVSQIAVLLNDGSWLRCDDTSKFIHAPYSPFLIGPSGDVAIYLTHRVSPDGEEILSKTVFDPNYGYRLTYIPANSIQRITFRHL